MFSPLFTSRSRCKYCISSLNKNHWPKDYVGSVFNVTRISTRTVICCKKNVKYQFGSNTSLSSTYRVTNADLSHTPQVCRQKGGASVVEYSYPTIPFMKKTQRILLLPPANIVCEGYVFTGVCLSTGGAIPACIAGGIPACLAAGLQGGSAPGGVPDTGGAWSRPPWDGYYCGRYASFWNAFLLLEEEHIMGISRKRHLFFKKPNKIFGATDTLFRTSSDICPGFQSQSIKGIRSIIFILRSWNHLPTQKGYAVKYCCNVVKLHKRTTPLLKCVKNQFLTSRLCTPSDGFEEQKSFHNVKSKEEAPFSLEKEVITRGFPNSFE